MILVFVFVFAGRIQQQPSACGWKTTKPKQFTFARSSGEPVQVKHLPRSFQLKMNQLMVLDDVTIILFNVKTLRVSRTIEPSQAMRMAKSNK